MVNVKHVLKDGTVVDDIRGIVITQEQFPEVYEIINRIMGEGYEKGSLQSTS